MTNDAGNNEGLTFIREIEWDDVFATWRDNEGQRTAWIEYAKARGFDSWEEWRLQYVNALRLPERSWALHHIDDPARTVPTFVGGPFRGWVENLYDGERARSFEWLAAHDGIRAHDGVTSIMESFPKETTVMGVRTANGIVITEGMHRCCAIARAAQEGKVLCSTVGIALGSALDSDLPVVGGFEKNR